MSADGCQVRLTGAAGTGLCGWRRDGRALDCSAHRKRMQLRGDYLAHIPVTRKPSRRPEDVAARRALAAANAARAIRLREQMAAEQRPTAARRGVLELA